MAQLTEDVTDSQWQRRTRRCVRVHFVDPVYLLSTGDGVCLSVTAAR